ncbi:MAG: carotenoid biosynthesis protein [Cyclobacteriaceae bacterium]
MKFSAKQRQFVNKKNILILIVLVLHFVGAIGSIIPEYAPLFLLLTPLNLFISSFILILSDSNTKQHLISILIITFLVGFFIEVIGIHTGLIFGSYEYGSTLGFKVFDVPLIIGLNWFLLTYVTHHFVHRIKNHFVAATIASLIMTATDVLIEPVAVKLSYWSWEGDQIPVHNYIGWFCISFFLHVLIRYRFKLQSFNELTTYLFGGQLFYFLVVFIFY